MKRRSDGESVEKKKKKERRGIKQISEENEVGFRLSEEHVVL